MEEERSLQAGESSHWWGDQARRRGSFRAREESVATGLQKVPQTGHTGGGPAAQSSPESLICWCGWGWALAQVSDVRPRKRTGAGCVKTG